MVSIQEQVMMARVRYIPDDQKPIYAECITLNIQF